MAKVWCRIGKGRRCLGLSVARRLLLMAGRDDGGGAHQEIVAR